MNGCIKGHGGVNTENKSEMEEKESCSEWVLVVKEEPGGEPFTKME